MSASDVLYADRQDAGRRLARAVMDLGLDDPVVLALPRGGVPVAFEVAKALGAPLDLLLVRKLGAPGHQEYGIGALVDGDNPQVVLNEQAMDIIDPLPAYVDAEVQRQLVELERRRQAYLGSRKPIPLAGREVVVVDDGIATGSTVTVAVRSLRKAMVARVTVAVPVAPADALGALHQEADEVICLATPQVFRAVGQHYADFTQTTDQEVVDLLEAATTRDSD